MNQSDSDTALNDDSGQFWRLQGVYIEHLPADGGLRIWVQGAQVVLGAESAASLHDWLDRCRS